MLRSKKAQASTMAMEELVRMIVGVITFIFLLTFFSFLYLAVTSSQKPPHETDFDWVARDLEIASPKFNSIITPIFSGEIYFEIIKTQDESVNRCPKESTCLCYSKTSNKKLAECRPLNSEADFKRRDKFKVEDNNVHITVSGTEIRLEN